MASLELRDICKSYGTVRAIQDVSLSIDEGEFVVLVGPSGCGKSTLLRCVAGLEEPSSGRLIQDGVDVTGASPVDRGVAMVFQSYALYPHMTIAENIGFGLKIAGEKKAVINARVQQIAKLLKVDGLLDRKPRALSGGQRQRVAIGRALAREPNVFLFDEPLSNLDASLRAEMRVELAKLHRALGNTMIYVTHDQIEGMTLADRIVIMNSGVVEQHGAPLELFNNPANKFVASFLGQPRINFIRVEQARRNGAGIELVLPGGTHLTVPARAHESADLKGLEVGIRPEDVSVSESGEFELLVDVVEQLGNETIVYGHLEGGQEMTARIAGQAGVATGATLPLKAAIDRVMLFDAAGANMCVPSARAS